MDRPRAPGPGPPAGARRRTRRATRRRRPAGRAGTAGWRAAGAPGRSPPPPGSGAAARWGGPAISSIPGASRTRRDVRLHAATAGIGEPAWHLQEAEPGAGVAAQRQGDEPVADRARAPPGRCRAGAGRCSSPAPERPSSPGPNSSSTPKPSARASARRHAQRRVGMPRLNRRHRLPAHPGHGPPSCCCENPRAWRARRRLAPVPPGASAMNTDGRRSWPLWRADIIRVRTGHARQWRTSPGSARSSPGRRPGR